jgi:hypothetical protein
MVKCGVWLGSLTGAACQRQHWTSHKRECRTLAGLELQSTFGRDTEHHFLRILLEPRPSDIPVLPKLSAITWTLRSHHGGLHHISLSRRAALLDMGQPAPGDTKETLLRLVKRAITELPWPELPGRTEDLFTLNMRALTIIADYGDPEAAVEILSRHVEEVERGGWRPSMWLRSTSIAWTGCSRRR